MAVESSSSGVEPEGEQVLAAGGERVVDRRAVELRGAAEIALDVGGIRRAGRDHLAVGVAADGGDEQMGNRKVVPVSLRAAGVLVLHRHEVARRVVLVGDELAVRGEDAGDPALGVAEELDGLTVGGGDPAVADEER